MLGKRPFGSIDDRLPAKYLDPKELMQLKRIRDLEEKATLYFTTKRRMDLVRVSGGKVVQKVLRVFVHSEFMAASDDDGAHQLLTVEGCVLDPACRGRAHFGDFFNLIRVEGDKRFFHKEVHEWSPVMAEGNRQVDVVQFKLYTTSDTNKQNTLRIYLSRADDLAQRVRISDALRNLLPNLAPDPLEEDVIQAFWEYLFANNLVDVRLRRLRPHASLDALFKVTGVENTGWMVLHTVRAKLREHHFKPVQPIEVQYDVGTPSSSGSLKEARRGPSARGGSATPAPPTVPKPTQQRPGWRIFCLEVDVEDPFHEQVAEALNAGSAALTAHEEKMNAMHLRACFLCQEIMHKTEQLETLQRVQDLIENMGTGGESEEAAGQPEKVALHEYLLANTDVLRLVRRRAEDAGDDEDDDDEEDSKPAVENEVKREAETAMDTGTRNENGNVADGTVVSNEVKSMETKEGKSAVMDVESGSEHGQVSVMSAAPTKVKAKVDGGAPPLAPPTMHSTGLHNLTCFVDVGDTSAFAGEQAWVTQASHKLAAGRPVVVPTERLVAVPPRDLPEAKKDAA